MAKLLIEVDPTNETEVRAAYQSLGGILGHVVPSQPLEPAGEKATTPKAAPKKKPAPKAKPTPKAAPKKVEKAPKDQEQSSDFTKDDIRQLVSEKKGDYRDAIRAKLDEMGYRRSTEVPEGEERNAFGEFLKAL